jgi:tRNA(adenine34) deaminase
MEMNSWKVAEQVLRKARWGAGMVLLAAGLFFASTYAGEDETKSATELAALEKQVLSLVPDPRYPQDPFILITLQEAIAAKREGSGGIGACLIRESTGEVVMRGHNRQFAPYWRSDMHAEMDLLNRYEDSVRILKNSGRNPRNPEGLVLYSSVEPCPMCLTRIINTGLKKVYYAAADPSGGMVHKLEDLPSFWREFAQGNLYAEANCSPAMKEIADRLFKHGMRLFKK